MASSRRGLPRARDSASRRAPICGFTRVRRTWRARISLFSLPNGRWSMIFIAPQSRRADKATANPDYGRNIAPIIMAPSSSIPTVTILKRCAEKRSEWKVFECAGELNEQDYAVLLGIFASDVGVLHQPILNHLSFEAPLISHLERRQLFV